TDPLAGENQEHVDKIKLFAWRGPDSIEDPATDVAGVGWILAENWWPYQRPSFVTPPFAGYISGHSTFSRAAAEVLSALTGDAFFPGGMSNFPIPANEFLVFERGPSVQMSLQWATYRDAADQCSLSRIWGGIHPPADDIPGRLIGAKVGIAAYQLAKSYFQPP
ncbi:MAG: vanadium-dependent haloperoxidase, partial [Gammaproteobacteria bacterium]|nr:vanadium-dependent haloperoxidase [Gammaproteobacteria bacterium]